MHGPSELSFVNTCRNVRIRAMSARPEAPWGFGRMRECAPTQCFPKEWWKWAVPKQHREVTTRLADYTEERLQDLIQEVLAGVTVQGRDEDATMAWAAGSEFDFWHRP